MWHKTLTTTFKGAIVHVLVFLSDSSPNGEEIVTVQGMLNEYYLIERITFEGRDNAYDFIKHYPQAMARAFVIRTAYETGAHND